MAQTGYAIMYRKSAVKELQQLPKAHFSLVMKQIASLAVNPYPVQAVKLEGLTDLFRVRQGVYRIIYTVRNKELIIEVVKVGHRREVYQKM